MKRTLILTTVMLVAFVFTQAQTLEKVLEKHYEATGVEKVADVKTFKIKAKISMMGMEMPMDMKIKNPNKFRVDVEMMGQKTIAAYDGEIGWMINPALGTGVKDLTGAELKQQMDQTDMEGELYNYEKKGSTAELIGKVNSDGKPAFKIKLTNKDGNAKDYFIDAETYLISKLKAKVEAGGQSMEVESTFTEYQEVEGIMMAKKVEAKLPMGTMTTTMDEIKLNEPIDDSVFAKPAE